MLLTAAGLFLGHLSRLRESGPGLPPRSHPAGDPRSRRARPEPRAPRRPLSGTAAAPRSHPRRPLRFHRGSHPYLGRGRQPVRHRRRTHGAAGRPPLSHFELGGAEVFRNPRHAARCRPRFHFSGCGPARAWRSSTRPWRATISRARARSGSTSRSTATTSLTKSSASQSDAKYLRDPRDRAADRLLQHVPGTAHRIEFRAPHSDRRGGRFQRPCAPRCMRWSRPYPSHASRRWPARSTPQSFRSD